MRRLITHLFLTLTLGAAFLSAPLLKTARAAGSDAAPALERIRFAPGATSARVEGELRARESERYVLRAIAGQLMEVNLSAGAGARLTVSTASGRVLNPSIRGNGIFRHYLPANGDYYLEVEAGSRAASYAVTVSIPERISFARGATSGAVEGELAAQQSHEYILGAQAGQLLEVAGDPDGELQLIIYGVDGTVLRSGRGEGASFRGQLPRTQDYLVVVRAGSRAVSYSLNVMIPQRISFERGSVSGSVNGWAGAHGSQYYVLRALKGQEMQVRVVSDENVQLIVYGADGTVLKSGMSEGSRFSGELPSTQDYILVVRAGARAAAYTLKATIR